MTFAPAGMDTPVCPEHFAVTAKPPEVLLWMKYSFLLVGRIRSRAADNEPCKTRTILRATLSVPSAMLKLVGEPALSATVCET